MSISIDKVSKHANVSISSAKILSRVRTVATRHDTPVLSNRGINCFTRLGYLSSVDETLRGWTFFLGALSQHSEWIREAFLATSIFLSAFVVVPLVMAEEVRLALVSELMIYL
jgi:hypothetical protein